MIVAFDTQEIADAMGVNRTSILRRAAKEEWEKVTQIARGGHKHFYLFESLPEDIRRKLQSIQVGQVTAATPQRSLLARVFGDRPKR
jgi:hypothetical protein